MRRRLSVRIALLFVSLHVCANCNAQVSSASNAVTDARNLAHSAYRWERAVRGDISEQRPGRRGYLQQTESAVPRSSLVQTGASILTRTPNRHRIALRATVSTVRPGDTLVITVVGYRRCADTTAARADERTILFDRAASSKTIREELTVPPAARYEITFDLASVANDEFFAAQHTSAVTVLEERRCS